MTSLMDDEGLMDELAVAIGQERDVPDHRRQAAYGAFAWRTVDQDLLTLMHDSSLEATAAVRAATGCPHAVVRGRRPVPRARGRRFDAHGAGTPPRQHGGEVTMERADGVSRSARTDASGFFTRPTPRAPALRRRHRRDSATHRVDRSRSSLTRPSRGTPRLSLPARDLRARPRGPQQDVPEVLAVVHRGVDVEHQVRGGPVVDLGDAGHDPGRSHREHRGHQAEHLPRADRRHHSRLASRQHDPVRRRGRAARSRAPSTARRRGPARRTSGCLVAEVTVRGDVDHGRTVHHGQGAFDARVAPLAARPQDAERPARRSRHLRTRAQAPQRAPGRPRSGWSPSHAATAPLTARADRSLLQRGQQ